MQKKTAKEKHYRLVLFSESTFEEVRSFHFRMWYIWLSVALVVVATSAFLLGLLTLDPIRTFIYKSTGYVAPDELIALREKINDLEDQSDAQTLYINNLRQLLSGEVITDTALAVSTRYEDTVHPVDRIAEDEALRNAFDLEEQLTAISREISDASASRSVEQLYLIPPVSGSISLDFDAQKEHFGIDINAPAHTPVKSVLAGHIIYAGWTLETGNTIGIQHDNDIISFYKHNSALLKKTGSFVQAGEAVAIIGNTGTLSSGPHLHFELWLDGRPVDPTKYINF